MPNIFFLILGGILLSYTFPPYNFSIFLYFSFIPFFLWMKDREGILSRIGGAFLFYISFAIFVSSPIFTLIKISFFHYLSHPLFIDTGLAILVYILLICFYSLPYLIFSLWIPYFLKKGITGIFLLSLGFAILEYLFSFFFPNLFVLGYAVNIGWFSKSFVSLFGVTGLTFFVIFSNLFIMHIFLNRKKIRWFPYLVFGFLLFLVSISFINIPTKRYHQELSLKNKKKINLLLVQRAINFEVPDFFRELEEFMLYSKDIKDYHPDLIVWPESAVPIRLSRYPHIERLIKDLPKKIGAYLVFGTYEGSENGGKYNQAVVFSPDGKRIKVYSKIKIIPFFEGPPNSHFLVEKGYPFKDRNFVKGEGLKLFTIKGRNFGILICSEVLFPFVTRKLREKGTDAEIVLSNEISLPKIYSLLLLNVARYRAIENRVFVIRVNTTGYSALISPFGDIIKALPYGKKDTLKAEMPNLFLYPTFYSRYGISPIVLSFLFLIFKLLLRNLL